MGTHESKQSPAEAASDALNFMKEIREKVSETLSIWIKSPSSPLTPNKLGDDKGMDSHHPYFHTGHMMSHSCSDCV